MVDFVIILNPKVLVQPLTQKPYNANAKIYSMDYVMSQ